MNRELEDLKTEVNILKERVNVLEKKERKRRTARLIGIIFKVIFYCAMIYGVYLGYEYIKNLPSKITEEIKVDVDLGQFDFFNLFGNKEKKSDN